MNDAHPTVLCPGPRSPARVASCGGGPRPGRGAGPDWDSQWVLSGPTRPQGYIGGEAMFGVDPACVGHPSLDCGCKWPIRALSVVGLEPVRLPLSVVGP